jgi:hypothetical protein
MAASNPTLEILKPRADWIVRRKAEAARTGDTNLSQMHFARKGLLTEEMAYVAKREDLAVEVIRDEVAAGTADYSGEREPSGAGADGDRDRDAVQGEREHRQLGDHVEHRRRAAQAAYGDPARGGHGDGSVDGRRYS